MHFHPGTASAMIVPLSWTQLLLPTSSWILKAVCHAEDERWRRRTGLLTYAKLLMTGREQQTRLTVTPVKYLHLRILFRCQYKIICISICNISHHPCHLNKWLLGSNLSPRDLVHSALLPRYRCSISDPTVKYRVIYKSCFS